MTKAWAAGVFDAEGCVTIHREKKGALRLSLRLVMGERAGVERFTKVMGCGLIRVQTLAAPRRPSWRWYCPKAHIARVARELAKYSVLRRRQLEIAIAFADAGAMEREQLWSELRETKTRRGRAA